MKNKTRNIKSYEIFEVKNTGHLKKNTIYFFLKSLSFSESFISELRKDNKSILLNHKISNLKSTIKNGDILHIFNNPNPTATQIQEINNPLDIIFEDDDFLIVNKPHNLSCMPTQSHFDNNLGGQIVFYMKKQNPNFTLRIINRLDKDTAGIVVVAKNLYAYTNFKFNTKEYFALCEGHTKQHFTINKPILTVEKDGINQMKRIISNNGKPAITHIETIQTFENFSLVKATLETGRTHQIRVHLSSESHPLLGDKIYNDTPSKQNPSHTFLILKNISFTHFRTQKTLSFCVTFPSEWNKFLK